MSMDRWDPLRDMLTFRDAMDRLVQQSISGTGQLLSTIRPEAIPMDVLEHDDAYEVRASVPGVKPEDVEVTVQGERLTVRAELRQTDERQGENWLMREQRYGASQRTITLPSPVSSDNAEARIEQGVLTLRLPKVQASRPRRINLAAGAATSPSRSAASPPAPNSTQTAPAPAQHTRGEQHGSRDHTAEGDKVTEESQESFPASDPPSWTPEKA